MIVYLTSFHASVATLIPHSLHLFHPAEQHEMLKTLYITTVFPARGGRLTDEWKLRLITLNQTRCWSGRCWSSRVWLEANGCSGFIICCKDRNQKSCLSRTCFVGLKSARRCTFGLKIYLIYNYPCTLENDPMEGRGAWNYRVKGRTWTRTDQYFQVISSHHRCSPGFGTGAPSVHRLLAFTRSITFTAVWMTPSSTSPLPLWLASWNKMLVHS